MAFGFQGPISPDGSQGVGDRGMVDYALSRCYRILGPERNSQVAACKICGATLPKDHGYCVSIATLMIRSPKSCYVCSLCFTPIRQASESFPLFDPLPSWWKLLDRKPVGKDEKLVSTALPKEELESLIKQREKKPTRRKRA